MKATEQWVVVHYEDVVTTGFADRAPKTVPGDIDHAQIVEVRSPGSEDKAFAAAEGRTGWYAAAPVARLEPIRLFLAREAE